MCKYVIVLMKSALLLLLLDFTTNVPTAKAASVDQQWGRMVASQKKKFKTDSAVVVRQGEFILSDRDDQFTVWAHFENQDGSLTHTHCRVGSKDDPNTLFLPLNTRYLQPTEESGRDRIFNYCCLPSTTEKIAAAIRDSLDNCKDSKVGKCMLLPDSQWCGVPGDIIKGGCLDDFLVLANGRYDGYDGLPFNAGTGKGSKIRANFICKEKKLILEDCLVFNIDPHPVIKHGEYLLFRHFYHVCPKAKSLETKEDLKNVGAGFLAVSSKDDPALSGLTQKLPPGFTEGCVADWQKITDDGERDFETDGHVTLINLKVRSRMPVRDPDVIGKFRCDKGTNPAKKLILEDCVKREFRDKKPAKDLAPRIPAAECRKIDGVTEALKGY